MGRGKYHDWLEPDNILLMQSWSRNRLTDEQIAHNMGIAYSALKVWKGKYPAISAALKKGKEVVDRDKDVIESERREFENRYSVEVLLYLI